VDDRSTENIRGIAKRYGASYVCTLARSGPAAARNLGAQQAIGEILIFVDADVMVPPDALRIIGEEFEKNIALAALFGSYDDEPGCGDFFSSFKNLLHHYVHQEANANAATFWTACGAIRKSVFQACGGFDGVRYPYPSIEDIELGVRLKRQNQQIRLVKRLKVKHLKKWTLWSMVRTDIVHRAIPWTQLILRTGLMPRDLNLNWMSRISAALVLAAGVLGAGAFVSPIRHLSGPARMLASGCLSSVMMLSYLNRELYRFFWRKRGTGFALGAMLVHWFYLFYSGAAFMLCCAGDFLQGFSRSPTPDLASHGAMPNSTGRARAMQAALTPGPKA
jgi:glycosyltransferase involved in cell wall biosynthesis